MKLPCLSMLQIQTCDSDWIHLQVSFSSMAAFVHLRPVPCLMRSVNQKTSISFSRLSARVLYMHQCVYLQRFQCLTLTFVILICHSYLVETKGIFPLIEWLHHTLHSLLSALDYWQSPCERIKLPLTCAFILFQQMPNWLIWF